MKKFFWFILVFVCIFALCSCQNNISSEPFQSGSDRIFTSPPKLSVVCEESSVEALMGISSWTYKNPDGTSTSIIADIMHPLDAKEYMTPLKLLPTYKSSVDPLLAYLFFEYDPDKVEVKCWDESSWDKADSDYETLSVSISDSEMADRTGRKDFCLQLKDGAYIYEIIAEWTENDIFSGKVHYSFYTTSPYLVIHEID